MIKEKSLEEEVAELELETLTTQSLGYQWEQVDVLILLRLIADWRKGRESLAAYREELENCGISVGIPRHVTLLKAYPTKNPDKVAGSEKDKAVTTPSTFASSNGS